jgi:hypothetical protein
MEALRGEDMTDYSTERTELRAAVVNLRNRLAESESARTVAEATVTQARAVMDAFNRGLRTGQGPKEMAKVAADYPGAWTQAEALALLQRSREVRR